MEGDYCMNFFWKVFAVSFVFFFVAIFLGSYSYIKINEENLSSNISGGFSIGNQEEQEGQEEAEKMVEENLSKENKTYQSLAEAFKDSDRINVVLLGMEDVRTDTIIFVSFDPEEKEANMISVPRDTYIHRRGYDLAEQRKINAVYGDHCIKGVKKTVSYIFKEAPIHHYVMVDYEGVEKVIDSIGGVEVVVPFNMKYDDPSSDPPLHIDIREGRQTLNGENALKFLRYRKGNNDVGYVDGDLGRIKAQQEFIKSFIDKSLSYRLPTVIRNGYDHIETDISLFKALNYARKLLKIELESINFDTLPGKAEFRRYSGRLLSYFIFNNEETQRLLEDIYNVKTP